MNQAFFICEECGKTNRAKAKFCSSCAARLRGVEPSGLSAPQAARPKRASTVRLLPAEMPGFWLRLMLSGVAMTVGFMAWYLYVTRDVTPSAPRTDIAAAARPEVPAQKPAPEAAVTTAPAVKPEPPAAPSTPAAAMRLPPVAAVAPTAAPAPRRESEQAAARPPAADTRARARTPRPAAEEPAGESAASVERTLALARALNEAGPQNRVPSRVTADPGPPVVPGPGPRYSWVNPPSSRSESDPGPPVAPGPGPRYDASRAPVRAPSAVRDDPGPPIAVGPGPLVDYSTPGARPR